MAKTSTDTTQKAPVQKATIGGTKSVPATTKGVETKATGTKPAVDTKTAATQTAQKGAQAKTTPRPVYSIHSIQHIEIAATQPEKLRDFLAKQFGWEFNTTKTTQGTDYHLFHTPSSSEGRS